MKLLILISFVILPFSSLAKRNVAFIGLSGNGAPSLEKGYENQLREKLSMESDIFTKDYLECQKFRRMIRFDDYVTVPRNYLEDLARIAGDSMLVIWGAVKNFRLSYQQKKLFFTEIKGELQIGLHIFSLLKRDFLFMGEVSADVYKSTGIGFFKSKQPVSAKDRAELIAMLQSEAAINSCKTIIDVIRAQNLEKPNVIYPVEMNEPSISDVFPIPSAEPAQKDSINTQQDVNTLDTSEEFKRLD